MTLLRKIYCAAVTIEDLMVQQGDLNIKARGIQEQADKEGRKLTEEETLAIKQACDEFDAIQADIDRRKRLQEQAAWVDSSAGRAAPAENPQEPENPTAAVAVAHGMPVQASKPRQTVKRVEESGPTMYGAHGFQNIGEFAVAVQRASVRNGRPDPRLIYNAPSATSSEGTPADGGYAIPPDFRNEIWRKVLGEASLMEYCDRQTCSSNSLTFPKDESTPWQSSGGVRVNWTSEGAKIAESKVNLGEETVKLEKLAALLPVTEELLEDAPAVARYISSRVPEVLGFTLNNAILNGTGTGQPAGILPSAALVTVAKEAGQTADTVTYGNIASMWARMHARGKNSAVWVMNPIVSEQLMRMAFPGAGTAVPVYLPPSGLSGSPYATLMGRPVVETEACPALGSVGDICLLDLSQYMIVLKSVGMRADVSMHLYFDYDVLTYRFILRVGGKPWWSAPITGSDNTTQYSAFVALAERA